MSASGEERAFADLEELATQCRFSNCTHGGEPGCALNAAVEAGTLSEGRLENYLKLMAEAEASEARHDVLESARNKEAIKRATRAYERIQRGRERR